MSAIVAMGRGSRALELAPGAIPMTGIVMPLAEQRGGAEAALVHYLRGLPAALRGSVHVAFLEHGPLAAWAATEGFSAEVFGAGRLREPTRWAACVRSLRHWMRAKRLEVSLSWMAKGHLYAAPAAIASKVVPLWWQHGLPTNRGIDLVASWLPARRIVCCSDAAAAAQRRLWARQRRLRTIYPPVDLTLLGAAPRSDAARERVGLRRDEVVVGILARLQRWKGVHVLLEAVSELVRERGDVRVVVVGGPHALELDYARELERQAVELGLGDRVVFAGQQPNPEVWLAAMDIVVSASFGEPFGMAIVEAMALGKPVIATRCGGPLEIIRDDVDGVLTTPGDARELAAALRALCADPEHRRKLGSAAMKSAQRYGVPRFVAEVNEALREAVAA